MKVISIHNFISSSGSGTVINYGSGSGSTTLARRGLWIRIRIREDPYIFVYLDPEPGDKNCAVLKKSIENILIPSLFRNFPA
jgi:hypothetical protein